jgi:hypothetical protein
MLQTMICTTRCTTQRKEATDRFPGTVREFDAVIDTATTITAGVYSVARAAMAKQNPGDMRKAQRHIRGLRREL